VNHDINLDAAKKPDLEARVRSALDQATDCLRRAEATDKKETRSLYLGLAATYESIAGELTKTIATIEAVDATTSKAAACRVNVRKGVRPSAKSRIIKDH
jgi:hypothetical protein